MRAEPTILVIEDDAAFLGLLVDYLEDSGYRVCTADDGLQGLEAFAREKPDLVLTDLRMPGKDGFEVLQALRKGSPEVPVVVVTGTGDRSVGEVALALGARACVIKPITDLGLLDRVVRSALAGEGASQPLEGGRCS